MPVVTAPLRHNDVIIMLLWRHNNDFITFLLHFLFCYFVLVLVFPIDVSFYDVLFSQQKWKRTSFLSKEKKKNAYNGFSSNLILRLWLLYLSLFLWKLVSLMATILFFKKITNKATIKETLYCSCKQRKAFRGFL